jgi:hypothetical protein
MTSAKPNERGYTMTKPSKDLTMNLEDRELVVLELMCRGEDILAHGAWEQPCKRLAMREFAQKVGNGYRITEKGKAYFATYEGVDTKEIDALAPKLPGWIFTVLEGEPKSLVVLCKNELAVSGYDAVRPASFERIVHGRQNDIDTVFLRSDVDGFLQAALDAAWAKGLRPTNG